MPISDEKYVALTTFRRSGEAKVTPVWIADLGDGTVGFTSASSSWKVKRIGNDPRVRLQPSDSKGRVKAGSEAVDGQAEVRTGAGFEPVRDAIKAKYGIQFMMIKLFGKLAKLAGKGSGIDIGVVVTLDG